MAEQTELDDLRERLAKLPLSQQLYLFELLLGDYRVRCERERAEARAMHEEAARELREAERRVLAQPAAEGKRAAG